MWKPPQLRDRRTRPSYTRWEKEIPPQTKSGKITNGKLKNNENTPVEIVAQTSDKLLVNSNYKNVTEYVPWVGVNQTVIGEMEYSLISKENYINNKADYKKIKMIGMSNKKQ